MNAAQQVQTAEKAHSTTDDNQVIVDVQENGFLIYISYIAKHLGHISWINTKQDNSGLWDCFTNSPYGKRLDMSPVIILETLRRKRENLGIMPVLCPDDLTTLKTVYSECRIRA